MDIRDSQRIKEIRDNTRAMAEAFSSIANTLADALELYISTRTETQIETQNSNLTFEKDECAKEYEELGLKELKELIEADRKTEPTTEDRSTVDKDINVRSKDEPQWTKENCKGCKYNEYPYDSGTCFVRVCINGNKYEPKNEPQTDCAWK